LLDVLLGAGSTQGTKCILQNKKQQHSHKQKFTRLVLRPASTVCWQFSQSRTPQLGSAPAASSSLEHGSPMPLPKPDALHRAVAPSCRQGGSCPFCLGCCWLIGGSHGEGQLQCNADAQGAAKGEMGGKGHPHPAAPHTR
jgi:hypothetical protein